MQLRFPIAFQNLLLSSTLVLTLFFIGAPFGKAQKVDVSALKGMQARSIGPAGMSGRVTSIDVNLSNDEHIIVGTASGGVWESTNGGTSWASIFDDAPLQNIGSVAFNQRNPSEIWVGTGEGNPRNSHNTGEGIYKSIDGGKTWKSMGLEKTRLIHRILIDPHHPNTVYVAALGSAWGPNAERGVFKTQDGGKTWQHVLKIDENTGCADLVMDPKNPNKLIAAMWDYRRQPWTFRSGGPGSGMHVTFDGGETWVKRTKKDGLPKGELGRMGLAIAPSNPQTVYALVESSEEYALYKSTDGGAAFAKLSTENVGNRPFYYADIFVDPLDEKRVYSLHTYVTRSEDGGKTFSKLLDFVWTAGVHPDHHALWIHPTNSDYIIEGNDGGLNISRDGGTTWEFVENLPLGQFYHVSVDNSTPYLVGGGMQDNGSWVGPSQVWQYGGIKNHHWQEVAFGDGFDVVFKPDDSRYVYAMSQGGNVSFIDRETGDRRFIKPVHPEGERLRFHWNAAIGQDPFDACTVYYGSQYVHKSTDCGATWDLISPDLTTNDTTKQKQYESGGLTIDDTDAENHTTILCIAPSTFEKEVLWVGTDDGRVQVTKDGGANWSSVEKYVNNFPKGAWIPQIIPSLHQKDEAFIVVNNYRQNDWRPMLYHATNYGKSMKRIVRDGDVPGYVLSVVQDPEEENLLFMGTEYGLYVSFDKGEHWNAWQNGFPTCPVRDLKIQAAYGDLVIGTFGRGIWILDDLRPLREMAAGNTGWLQDTFRTFASPTAYMASYKSVNEARFIADGEFVGVNRPSGAQLSYWLHPKVETGPKGAKEAKMNASTAKKPEKIAIQIVDNQGDTIRSYQVKADTGLVRTYWNFSENGVAFPSRTLRKPDADVPSGTQAYPGTYTAILRYGNILDSAEITVQSDPRLDYDLEAHKAMKAAHQELNAYIVAAAEAAERLNKAQATVDLMDKRYADFPVDTVKTQLADAGKALKDSTEQILVMMMAPKDERGYVNNDHKLNSLFYTARTYIDNSKGPLTPSAVTSVEKVKQLTGKVIEATNQFFSTEWPAYQRLLEQYPVDDFKVYAPIKIE